MSIITTNNQYYTDIAEAIRSKNGTESFYKPSEMAEAIKQLEITSNYWSDFTSADDGKTRFAVGFFGKKNRSISLCIPEGITIDWGDGTIEPASKDIPTHTYSTEKDDYVIMISEEFTPVGNGNWDGGNYVQGIYSFQPKYANVILYKVVYGSNCLHPLSCVGNVNLLEAHFHIKNELAQESLIEDIINDYTWGFSLCPSLQNYNFSSWGVFGSRCWRSYEGTRFEVPENIKAIGSDGLPPCDIYMNSETPPIAYYQDFWNGDNYGYKIYVPKDFLQAYQSQTNWAAKSDSILPREESV